MKTVVTILQLLCGLAIILIVLFQSGKSQGLSGAIGGVADSAVGGGEVQQAIRVPVLPSMPS